MARPYLEEQALKRIADLVPDAMEELDAIINYAETELEKAQGTYDKERQKRIATMLVNVSRLTLTVSRIRDEAKP